MRNRCDATRYLNLDGMHKIMPYVLPKRTEAECSLTETFDVTALKAYIKKKTKKKDTTISIFMQSVQPLAERFFIVPC